MSEGLISVVIGVYNAERYLAEAIDSVLGQDYRPIQLIVVDDGSTDGTADMLAREQNLGVELRVITFGSNRGKGAAVQAGVRAARGDRVLMSDVDLSTPLEELAALSAEMDAGVALAIGSRAVEGARVLVHQPRPRELLGKLFNLLLRVLTGLPWRDTQCGFKLFERATVAPVFELQTVHGYAFDAELCLNAYRRGLAVVEVPVRWTNDPDTRLRPTASAQIAFDLLRIGLAARRTRRHSHA